MSKRVELLTTLRLRQLDTAVNLTEAQETALRPVVENQMRGLAKMRRAQR